jgi:hypothetical protein
MKKKGYLVISTILLLTVFQAFSQSTDFENSNIYAFLARDCKIEINPSKSIQSSLMINETNNNLDSYYTSSFFNNSGYKRLKTKTDSIDYKIDYTRYCLQKFRQERLWGIWLQISGGVIIAGTNLNSLNGVSRAERVHELELQSAHESIEGRMLADAKYDMRLREIEKKIKTGMYIGGAIALTGSVLQIISYRWLKRAYIMPYEYGFSVTYEF